MAAKRESDNVLDALQKELGRLAGRVTRLDKALERKPAGSWDRTWAATELELEKSDARGKAIGIFLRAPTPEKIAKEREMRAKLNAHRRSLGFDPVREI
jgi:hypothetical protein